MLDVWWSSRPVFIMSRAAALLWWRFHLVIIVYHQTRPGLTRPGLTKVVLGKYPRWWWMMRTGGAGGRLIILILSFDWVTVLTFGSSPVQSPVLFWFCPGDIFMNIEIISTIPLRTFLGPERKYSLFTAGPDSGWCCISSFHLLFKSLLNIPRGPRTARISLH